MTILLLTHCSSCSIAALLGCMAFAWSIDLMAMQMFKKLNKNPSKPIYEHFTCATDTSNIRHVFDAVRSGNLPRLSIYIACMFCHPYHLG